MWNPSWLVELKLVLHGVAQKFEQKKFVSFFAILMHCLAENPTFRHYHWIEQQKVPQYLKFCSWPWSKLSSGSSSYSGLVISECLQIIRGTDLVVFVLILFPQMYNILLLKSVPLAQPQSMKIMSKTFGKYQLQYAIEFQQIFNMQ